MIEPDATVDIEGRVLRAVVSDKRWLALADELCVDDFAHPHNRTAFTHLRNVEARGDGVSVAAIANEDERVLAQRDQAPTHVIARYVSALVSAPEPFFSDPASERQRALFVLDLRDLRERAERAGKPVAKFGAKDFLAMPIRIAGEREERQRHADRAMNYQLRFLDDCIRAILPHDLVLLGAPTGMGKTDMALAIAMANADAGERRVAYYALEAEPRELERRTKYAKLSLLAHERRIPDVSRLNYTDWLLGRCDHIVDGIDREVDTWMVNHLSTLRTFYRGKDFNAEDLTESIDFIHDEVDLIVVDHLHYVDTDNDENEHRALGDAVKKIRDVSLRVGKPVLLVAHLRKRDPRTRQLVPTLDDFHGSSNITKIATQVITLERASCIDAPKWWLSPTFMAVLKDRRAGTTGLVALTHFDRRSRKYADEYTLGRLIKGGTEWEAIKPAEQPTWATGHKQLEMEV